MTTLETQFLLQLKEEAYGGTLFVGDINPSSITANQKSGVVSSLVQKGILTTDEVYGQIGIVAEGDDPIYEISKQDVQDLINRL